MKKSILFLALISIVLLGAACKKEKRQASKLDGEWTVSSNTVQSSGNDDINKIKFINCDLEFLLGVPLTSCTGTITGDTATVQFDWYIYDDVLNIYAYDFDFSYLNGDYNILTDDKDLFELEKLSGGGILVLMK